MSKNKGKARKYTQNVKYKKTEKTVFNDLIKKVGSMKEVSKRTGISYYNVRKLNELYNKPQQIKRGLTPTQIKSKAEYRRNKKEQFAKEIQKAAKNEKIPIFEQETIARGEWVGQNKLDKAQFEVGPETRLIFAKFAIRTHLTDGTTKVNYLSQTFYKEPGDTAYRKDIKEHVLDSLQEYISNISGLSYVEKLILLEMDIYTYNY